MTEAAKHICTNEGHRTGLTLNGQTRRDPTRTTTLRNQFAREMGKRFRELRGLIREAIVDRDCFGLQNNPTTQALPQRRAFDFPRSQDKVSGFMEWLRRQEDQGILEIRPGQQIGEAVDNAWTNQYIQSSYQKGVYRARQELVKAGYQVPGIEESGGIGQAFNQPFHMDRVGLMYTRTFSDLKGITDTMDNQISRVLSQAMAEGKHPNEMARLLNRTISGPVGDLGLTDTLGRFIPAERRARILARTETIRSHHMATIQEYKNWQVEGVQVQAEWSTAGDDRVCTICIALEGSVYDLKTVESMIPRHPQCRCIALPVDVTDQAAEETVIDQPAEEDPIAARIEEDELKDVYLARKREMDEAFDDLDLTVPERATGAHRNWSREEILNKYHRRLQGENFGTDEDAFLQNVGVQLNRKLEDKVPEFQELAQDWKWDPQGAMPKAFQAKAAQIERGLPDVAIPETWQYSQFQRKMYEDAFETMTNDAYLRIRAFNQAYMERTGVEQVRMFRGLNNGPSTNKIVDALQQADDTFVYSDATLSGYSSDPELAHYFAFQKKPDAAGVMVRVDIDRDDIIVHPDVFEDLTDTAEREYEFIVSGGSRRIRLGNVKYRGAVKKRKQGVIKGFSEETEFDESPWGYKDDAGNLRGPALGKAAPLDEVDRFKIKAAPRPAQNKPMSSIGDKSNCIIEQVTNNMANIAVHRVSTSCTDYVRGDDGYWYRGNDPVPDDVAQRLDKMGLPPAWRNVVVSADPDAKVQAIGLDTAGRWQYRYSAEHIEAAARKKFDRVKSFSRDTPTIRRGYNDGIANGDPRAYALLLEDHTAARVGSARDFKAKVKAYGLSTLEKRHVSVSGNKVTLDFMAKSGKRGYYEVHDQTLADWIRRRLDTLEDNDQLFYDVSSDQLNDYLAEVAGRKAYTVKDFRTYHGTRIAHEEIKQFAGQELTRKQRKEIVKNISEKVSTFLSNTPSTARKSYIDPMVWDYIGGLP